MPDKRYTKVEEEVIQILDRLESEKPSRSRPQPSSDRRWPSRKTSWTARRSFKPSLNLSRVTAGRPWIWLASAFVLAFVAILVRDTSENLALALALGSIIAFIAPIFVGRRGGGAGNGPGGDIKQWRGRDISFDDPDGPSPADRISRWIQERRGRGPLR